MIVCYIYVSRSAYFSVANNSRKIPGIRRKMKQKFRMQKQEYFVLQQIFSIHGDCNRPIFPLDTILHFKNTKYDIEEVTNRQTRRDNTLY